MRALRSFVAFWYDFLVGDRPELFLGSLGVLVITRMMVAANVAPAIAALVMVGCVVAVLAASLVRAVARR